MHYTTWQVYYVTQILSEISTGKFGHYSKLSLFQVFTRTSGTEAIINMNWISFLLRWNQTCDKLTKKGLTFYDAKKVKGTASLTIIYPDPIEFCLSSIPIDLYSQLW